MRLRTDDIAAAVVGQHDGPVVEVDGAAIDTRAMLGGELFVPIVAERDGHDYLAEALAAAAPAYLTERAPLDSSTTAISVADTGVALLDVGRLARGRLPDLVVGITGSVGKTTVKDLTAAALRTRYRTAASERSFNNELGVPLTLAGAPDDTEAVVAEMGARGRGHIALLCDVARPTIGVVTTVALAHAEMFGTLADVAATKGELIAALPANGTAVLNADDDLVAAMAGRSPARVLTFGSVSRRADVCAEGVVVDDELLVSFVIRSPWGAAAVRLPVRGIHQVANGLAAAAAALAGGVDPDDVAAGLAAAAPSPWRMELVHASSGALVLNDAYNANPTSTAAALDSLAALPARRRVAVLGVMAELGPSGALEHRRIAEHARALGIEVIAVDAADYGLEVARGIEGALLALGSLGDGDAVLVKASRIAGLERLASALAGGEASTV